MFFVKKSTLFHFCILETYERTYSGTTVKKKAFPISRFQVCKKIDFRLRAISRKQARSPRLALPCLALPLFPIEIRLVCCILGEIFFSFLLLLFEAFLSLSPFSAFFFIHPFLSLQLYCVLRLRLAVRRKYVRIRTVLFGQFYLSSVSHCFYTGQVQNSSFCSACPPSGITPISKSFCNSMRRIQYFVL